MHTHDISKMLSLYEANVEAMPNALMPSVNNQIWVDMEKEHSEINAILHDLKLHNGLQIYNNKYASWITSISVRPSSNPKELSGKVYTAFVSVASYNPSAPKKRRKIKHKTLRMEYSVVSSVFANLAESKEQLENVSLNESLQWVMYHAPLLYMSLISSYGN